MLDGLVLTGGDFDIDPSFYGEAITNERVVVKDIRTQFEMGVLRAMMQKGAPILGICAGQQLMNVMLGGSLIQHIPDEIANCLEHEQKTDKHLVSHTVKVSKGSLLHNLVNSFEFEVNSTHHQAVKSVGKNIKATAIANDGVVEAIESTNLDFFLGVQWHPEYLTTEQDKMIFSGFISACKKKNKE